MTLKKVGVILLVLGVVVLLVSLFADPLGLGDAPGFGPNQIYGTIGGVVAAVVGWSLTRVKEI